MYIFNFIHALFTIIPNNSKTKSEKEEEIGAALATRKSDCAFLGPIA